MYHTESFMSTTTATNLFVTIALWIIIIVLLTRFFNRNYVLSLKNKLVIIITSFCITCIVYYALANLLYKFYTNGLAVLLFLSIPFPITYSISELLRKKDV